MLYTFNTLVFYITWKRGFIKRASHLATAKHTCTYLSIPYMNALKVCQDITEGKTRGSHSKWDPSDTADFVCTIQRNFITTYNTYIKKIRFFCLYFNHLILSSNIRFNLRYSLKVLFSDTQYLAEFKGKKIFQNSKNKICKTQIVQCIFVIKDKNIMSWI